MSLSDVFNAEMLRRDQATKAFLGTAHKMLGAAEAELKARHLERHALICLLRDKTNSAAVHARCVAIVGERS